MELNYAIDERPSAFAAVWAPVSGLPGAPVVTAVLTTAPRADRGRNAVGGLVTQVAQVQMTRHESKVQGTSGLAAKDVPTAKIFGAARGVPPRGRPV